MSQRITGPGVGAQVPQYLYPNELSNAPLDFQSAYQTLGPGQAIAIPAGSWYITPGPYCVVQDLDPINGIWRGLSSARSQRNQYVSDGYNLRVANLTGCAVAAVVTAGGSGYAQSTTTVTSSSGGSTWQAVVGGMLSVSTISATGSGYGIPPMVIISQPPSPGVQATGYATITSGTVSAVTLSNVGAGYVTAPTAVIVTSPYDPNIANTIVRASVSLAVVGSGSVSAILCTNPGASIAAAPTLTIAGAGTSAAATALRMSTLASATVASSGTWTGGAALTTAGGGSAVSAWNTNPAISGTNFIPRSAQAVLSGGSASLTSIGTLYDGGLYLGTPAVVVSPVGGIVPDTITATVTGTFAGVADTVLIQPAP